MLVSAFIDTSCAVGAVLCDCRQQILWESRSLNLAESLKSSCLLGPLRWNVTFLYVSREFRCVRCETCFVSEPSPARSRLISRASKRLVLLACLFVQSGKRGTGYVAVD